MIMRDLPSNMVFDYVGLSNAICRYPPLLPMEGGLSHFEFVVGANLISLAWAVHSGYGRKTKLAAGKKAMKKARPEIIASRGDKDRPDIKVVGSDAYHKTPRPPVPNKIELAPISARALLTKAGFASGGKSVARLYDALDRLCDPICERRGMLVGWEQKNGQLKIILDSGLWISTKRFKKVVQPLPTDTHRNCALPLYLLLHLMDFDRSSKQSMSLDDVREALGIMGGRSNHAKESIRRAVRIVNAQRTVQVMNARIVEEGRVPAQQKVDLLPRIEVSFDDGKVRFIDIDADARWVAERRAMDAEYAAEALAEAE